MAFRRKEFLQDDFGEEHISSSEHVISDEYSYLDETSEYDERFFHSDEYNQEFTAGLKEKEQEEKIGLLEEKMVGVEGTLRDMMSMLSNALEQSKSKRSKEE